MARRTRIVCTIGPASSSKTMLFRMIQAGMNVARLNFSHGTHAEHAQLLKSIRASAQKHRSDVAILQDLQGPKIRVGALPEGGIELHEGQEVIFSTKCEEYETNGPVPVSYKQLHEDLQVGHHILLDDGFLEVRVTGIKKQEIFTKVIYGGILKTHKGMNFPQSTISVDPFTKKDRDDVEFGIGQEVDWLVLSFISEASVAERVRKIVHESSVRQRKMPPLLMAKIETRLGVERIDEILASVDGIMIGRGDLGLEIPMEEVPIVQKEIIEKCRRAGKPVIVATQMLDSMSRNPRATRAEISDVANAVLDHTDAVMLSGESASGRYPAATVQAMAAVIDEAEASRFDHIDLPANDVDTVEHGVAHAVSVFAEKKFIKAIVTSASIPDVVACLPRYRTHVPILVGCESAEVARRLLLHAGVMPFIATADMGTFVPRSHALLVRRGILHARDRVAYVVGGGGSLSLTLYGG